MNRSVRSCAVSSAECCTIRRHRPDLEMPDTGSSLGRDDRVRAVDQGGEHLAEQIAYRHQHPRCFRDVAAHELALLPQARLELGEVTVQAVVPAQPHGDRLAVTVPALICLGFVWWM